MRAVVDIGSNSVKFSVAKMQRSVASGADSATLLAKSPPEIVKKGAWVTRLGKGLKVGGNLDPASVLRTEEVLREIAREIAPLRDQIDKIVVVATSAVRDCGNPDTIAIPVQNILGVPLRILSGAEEARLSVDGAAAAARAQYGRSDGVFIDVGGASTEVGSRDPIFQGHSFQAGAVRCHEALGLEVTPVSDAAWTAALTRIETFFPDSEWRELAAVLPQKGGPTVAVGGSLVLAARLAQAQAAPSGVGFLIARSQLEELNERLRRLSAEKRLKLPHMEKGRADIVCAGILCLTTVLRRLESAGRARRKSW